MDTDAIRALKVNTFSDVKWGPADKPILIADGRLIRINDLDTPLDVRSAYVVGVNQKSFQKLCRFFRSEILHFYEMHVNDLNALTNLRDLKQLAIRWNTKLVDISPLSHLRELRVLVLEDTPKVVELSPIIACTKLRAVEYSGGIWNRNTAASLTPLGHLPELEELVLTNIRVQEEGLKPLARCKKLRWLDVSNQFPTEDYAFLSVALPQVECSMFAPHIKLKQAIDGKDVMVVGSRKPFLSSTDDIDRIEKYEKAFARLRAKFASNHVPKRTPQESGAA